MLHDLDLILIKMIKHKHVFSADSSSLKESALQKQVEKLNRENLEHSHVNAEADRSAEDAGSKGSRQEPEELILDGSDTRQVEDGRTDTEDGKYGTL